MRGHIKYEVPMGTFRKEMIKKKHVTCASVTELKYRPTNIDGADYVYFYIVECHDKKDRTWFWVSLFSERNHFIKKYWWDALMINGTLFMFEGDIGVEELKNCNNFILYLSDQYNFMHKVVFKYWASHPFCKLNPIFENVSWIEKYYEHKINDEDEEEEWDKEVEKSMMMPWYEKMGMKNLGEVIYGK